MLVTLKEVLKTAEEKKAAIPGFNIDNIETVEAIMEACEAEAWPVILTVGQFAVRAGKMVFLADLVKRIGNETSLPVVLHLDHSVCYEQIMEALRLGFTSVMYDGSKNSFDENVKESQAVIRSAHAVGASVECELGAVGGVEDGMRHETFNLVDLGQVESFISKVPCDALAIGIGNAHGIYEGTPKLDFDRLAACSRLPTPPLVLHGGSCTPDEMIQKAIELGIRKINVATELRLAFMKGIRLSIEGGDFYEMYASGKKHLTELARHKIRLFKREIKG